MPRLRLQAGELVRVRRTAREQWFYGLVVEVADGIIHVRDEKRIYKWTQTDSQWRYDNGMLEHKFPKAAA